MCAIANRLEARRFEWDYNLQGLAVKNTDKKIETDSTELRLTLQDERMVHLATKEDLADLRRHTDTSMLELRNHTDTSILGLQNHTHRSILELRNHMDRGILELRNHLDRSIAELRHEISMRMQNLETKVARWLLAHIVVKVTLLVSILGVILDRLPAS